MKKLRFLHISTGDSRGAFSGAYRLHRNLIESGHQSLMFVGNKSTLDDSVIAPSAFEQYLRYVLEKTFSLLAKFVFKSAVQESRVFKTNIPFISISKYLKKFKDFSPDLIIVYYVADFLSEEQLYKIKQSTNARVVFYLMDMGMLTGSCHYAWGCDGYAKDCSDCPVTNSSFLKRRIASKWKSRDVVYRKIDPLIVSGSEQLRQQVSMSSLVKDMRSHKILIGINENIYNQNHREDARRDFGFLDGDIVLYFGAQNVLDIRKGFNLLLDALILLSSRLPNVCSSKVHIFTVGSGKPLEGSNLNFRHTHISYISDQAVFARTYAASDLFICPSVEDSGPMMINEAMVCGTPVAAFDLGVAKDLVVDAQTGFLADSVSGIDLARAIEKYLHLTDVERLSMRKNCRERGLAMCSLSVQVNEFLNLPL